MVCSTKAIGDRPRIYSFSYIPNTRNHVIFDDKVVFKARQMASQLNREPEIETKATTLLDRTFRDSEGKIVIAQPPNLPLLVGLAATLLELALPGGKLQSGVDLIAFGALFTWAWQELFEGVNYFRRTLGLIVLLSLIALRLHLF